MFMSSKYIWLGMPGEEEEQVSIAKQKDDLDSAECPYTQNTMLQTILSPVWDIIQFHFDIIQFHFEKVKFKV